MGARTWRSAPFSSTLVAAPAAALAALLLLACSGYTSKRRYVLATPAPEARVITVTVDTCECAACRVAVVDPATQYNIFNRTGLPAGLETVAASCYLETTVGVVLECGDCRGPGTCAAQVTVKAKGDSGEVTLTPAVGCTTAIGAGGQCQDQEILPIDPATPTTNCTALPPAAI